MFELLTCMIKEEWRMHSSLFGNLMFVLFPVLVTVFSFLCCLVLPVFQTILSFEQLALLAQYLFVLFGVTVGTFGLLGLESSPIAIAFSNETPEGVEQLKGRMRLCQMLDKVRLEGASFYTNAENHECVGGAQSCGLIQPSERLKTGEFLVKDLGLFGSTRAARRLSARIRE